MHPKSTHPANTVCQQCGTPFYAFPSRLKQGRGKFCGIACFRAFLHTLTGERARHWQGGRFVEEHGYVMQRVPGKGYAKEHRLVMAERLGRPLRDDEVVHHKDEARANNAPDNLQVVSRAEHGALHRIRATLWSRKYRACLECGTTERPHHAHGLCRRCLDARRRR